MRGFCECCESDRENTLHSQLHHQTGLFCHFGGTCDTKDIYVVLNSIAMGHASYFSGHRNRLEMKSHIMFADTANRKWKYLM